MNINNYEGIPYSLRPIDGCLNCWGLVALVYRNEVGKDIPMFNAGNLSGISRAFTAAFASGEHGFSVVNECIDFDVVVFINDRGARSEYHCGIIYNNKVLHATNKIGQVVYQALDVASKGFNRVEFWRR